MSACRRDFHETKYISFLIKDDELLEKYNEIWRKDDFQCFCLWVILIDSVYGIGKNYYPEVFLGECK